MRSSGMGTMAGLATALGGFLLFGCGLESPTAADIPPPEPVTLESIRIPKGFQFAMQGMVSVRLEASPPHAPAEEPSRVQVGVLTESGEFDLIYEGFLDTDGRFSCDIPIAARLDRVALRYEAGAETRMLVLPIQGNRVSFPGPTISDRSFPGSLTPAASPGALSLFDLGPGGGIPSLAAKGPALLPEDLQNFPIASVSYYPSQSSHGTLAFEDNWPSKGDYDFNDLVLSYQVVQYRNPASSVVAMEFLLRVQAAGAGFRNGFGFSLPIDRTRVIKAYGGMSGRVDEVGMEPGHEQAVFILFDDPGQVLGGTAVMVNTLPGESLVESPELRFVIQFQTPLQDHELGEPPFDPFLIVNGDRGREVHLIGSDPTALVNPLYSGTEDDAGQYRTATGLPWALLVPGAWDWPAERVPVNEAHLEFITWAESGGTEYTDWYLEKGHNRNGSKVIVR